MILINYENQLENNIDKIYVIVPYFNHLYIKESKNHKYKVFMCF